MSLASAGDIRINSSILGELLARLRLVQCRFVNFSAKTKCKFSRFNFLRIAQLHFDGHRADDRHPVAVIDDALHEIRKELPLVVERLAALEAYRSRWTRASLLLQNKQRLAKALRHEYGLTCAEVEKRGAAWSELGKQKIFCRGVRGV